MISGNKQLTIVNIFKNVIENTLQNDKLKNVYSFIQLRNGNILCGCDNGLICLYDIKSNTLSFREEEIHKESVSCLLNINKYQFISSSYFDGIKVWEY